MKTLLISEQAKFIQDTLTQRLAAYCLGLDSGILLGQLIRGELTPTKDQEQKISQLAELLKAQITFDDPSTIQNWYLGQKDYLNDKCPAALLHESFNDNFKRIQESVEYYILSG